MGGLGWSGLSWAGLGGANTSGAFGCDAACGCGWLGVAPHLSSVVL